MGYTHYWYREKEIDQETFDKIRNDFKKFLPLFKTLDIKLAGGNGEGQPEINKDAIIFNGSRYCGHEKKDFGIAWPANTIKNGVATNPQQAVVGSWFAGAKLNQRTCDGDCSHETFYFPRVLDNSAKPVEPIAYYNANGMPHYRSNQKEVGKYFDFTKTAFKPYDLAVNIALIIAKHHLGNKIIISSDDEWQHWSDAFIIVKNALGYEDFKLRD